MCFADLVREVSTNLDFRITPPEALGPHRRSTGSRQARSQNGQSVRGATRRSAPPSDARRNPVSPKNRQRVTDALPRVHFYGRHVDRAEASKALPDAYAIALRLRDEGVEPDAVARVLDVEPEAVGPLLTLAEGKLAGLMDPQ
jgi:DNA-directed RNA polymerase specialized sigma24 family protein